MVLCMWSLLWKGNFIYNYLIIIIQIFYRFCTDNYNDLCMSFKKKKILQIYWFYKQVYPVC